MWMVFVTAKKRKPIVTLAAGICLAAAVPLGFSKETPHNATVERYVNRRATKEGGSANIIQIVRGDLDNDGDADTVANYGVEGIGGGNLSRLYIAVFLNSKGKLSFKTETAAGVAGTGSGRLLNVRAVENGNVLCDTFEFLPDDGACCPSVKGVASFVLKRGKLLESKS